MRVEGTDGWEREFLEEGLGVGGGLGLGLLGRRRWSCSVLGTVRERVWGGVPEEEHRGVLG